MLKFIKVIPRGPSSTVCLNRITVKVTLQSKNPNPNPKARNLPKDTKRTQRILIEKHVKSLQRHRSAIRYQKQKDHKNLQNARKTHKKLNRERLNKQSKRAVKTEKQSPD